MKHADPRRNPNGWLAAIMLDLLEQDTEESKKLLADAIRVTAYGIEPGLIDELFWTWIESYISLLDETQNNQSNDDPQCSPEDLTVSSQECKNDSISDRLDTEGDTK